MSLTRSDLRTHYVRVKSMITAERKKRESVLNHSPLLPKKLKECDDALTSLAVLGEALNELLPPTADGSLTDATASQPALLDVPPIRRPYT